MSTMPNIMPKALMAALLLPLLWFAGSWVVQQRAIGAGSTWVIPVEGYDPRDLLRGHNIRFRYAWAVRGEARLCRTGACYLCLAQSPQAQNGAPPLVVATIVAADQTCRHRVDTGASDIVVQRGFGRQPQFFSRIFVSESRAPQMEKRMQAGGVAVETSLTADGRLVNQRLVSAEP